MTQHPGGYHTLPTPENFERVSAPMELRCGPCGRTGKYSVGTVLLHPNILKDRSNDSLNASFGCTGYFRCRFCDAGGPWELTALTTLHMMGFLALYSRNPTSSPLRFGEMQLFDGTRSRFATQGEAHLKGLIEKRPDYYFLYNRLGNLYKSAGVPHLAVEAYNEALKRNEHDVESMYMMAHLREEEGDAEQAAEWYRQALLHARHCPDEAVPMLRTLVENSFDTLAQIHLCSDGKIPMFTKSHIPEVDASKPLIVKLHSLDPSNREDRESLIDMWVGDRARRPGQRVEQAEAKKMVISQPLRKPSSSERIGRNDPCPCGSGKKFKACCMR